MKNDTQSIAKEISDGKAVLGIEFGSTRIKAVLIDTNNEPVASGAFDWENALVDGVWTYELSLVKKGLQACYASLKADVMAKYNVRLTKLAGLGISAMMHGYLAFDKNDNLLVPFRTWRNTMTRDASEKLSLLFNYPVPERWSIAHLYQAMLNDEAHVANVNFITTLAGYVHYLFTGQKVIGIGDASGMFPINTQSLNYDEKMLGDFEKIVKQKNYSWHIADILPRVLVAGADAGNLSKEGALLLDPTADLVDGTPLAPPEGDAGTGMVATNSISVRKGNVSAGTSVFAMVVLEKALSKTYSGKIDLVTTPSGALVAMAHANNCTGEYDNWIRLFGSVLEAFGFDVKKSCLYDTLLNLALKADADCGGIIPFNYLSGESMTNLSEGRALLVRTQKCNFTLANFMRAQLFTALGALRTGMDILFNEEKVCIDSLNCHGGFFKAEEVGLKMMASAMHTKVSALETAGEGGPWGMALLAAYRVRKNGKTLDNFLQDEVFANAKQKTVTPNADDVAGFDAFFARYSKALALEQCAISCVE